MEFQRRGAPHFHISTVPPMGFVEILDPDAGRVRSADFRTWLSITCATSSPTPTLTSAAGTGSLARRGLRRGRQAH